MEPSYYADLYRRYQTYVRTYDWDNRIYKIACGPNAEDYGWTETVMKKAHWLMDGLSLHYYTVTHDWGHKGSATEFSKDEYYKTLRKAYHIDEIIRRLHRTAAAENREAPSRLQRRRAADAQGGAAAVFAGKKDLQMIFTVAAGCHLHQFSAD